jgi:hypothetical protein
MKGKREKEKILIRNQPLKLKHPVPKKKREKKIGTRNRIRFNGISKWT